MAERRYPLWDIESEHLVSSYESEADALAGVREAVRLNGPEDVKFLGLTYTDDGGRLVRVAAGGELLRRAIAARPPRTASA